MEPSFIWYPPSDGLAAVRRPSVGDSEMPDLSTRHLSTRQATGRNPGYKPMNDEATIMLAALAGGAAGPWATGLLYDLSGSYTLAFAIGIAIGKKILLLFPETKPTLNFWPDPKFYIGTVSKV